MKLSDLDAFMRMVTEHATRKITPLLPTTMWATVTTASPLRIRPDTADEPWPIAPIDLVGGLAEGDRVRVTIRSGQAYIDHKLGGGSGPVAPTLIPAMHVRASASQPTTAGTTVPITLNTPVIATDIGGCTHNAGKITVPKAGLWLVSARVRWAAASTATGYRSLMIRRNGVREAEFVLPGAAVVMTSIGLLPVATAAGDYIDMAIWQTSGGGLDVLPNSEGTGLAVTYQGPPA